MHPYQHGRRETLPREKEAMSEVHPDFAPPPPAKAKHATRLYRVHRNAEVTPGVMIETALLAASSDKALQYLKVSGPDYVANAVHGIHVEGPEGQIILSRYAPPADNALNIYKLELTKNVRERSYFLLSVVAASEAEARAMLPTGMTREQSTQFGWAEDQVWTCLYVGKAAPAIVAPVVLTAQQKW